MTGAGCPARPRRPVRSGPTPSSGSRRARRVGCGPGPSVMRLGMWSLAPTDVEPRVVDRCAEAREAERHDAERLGQPDARVVAERVAGDERRLQGQDHVRRAPRGRRRGSAPDSAASATSSSMSRVTGCCDRATRSGSDLAELEAQPGQTPVDAGVAELGHADRGDQRAPEPLERVGQVDDGVADHAGVGVHRLFEHGEEQVVLALEVLVERAERLAGLVGHVLHREPVAVRALEQPGRRLDEAEPAIDRSLRGGAQRPPDDAGVPVGRASPSASSGVISGIGRAQAARPGGGSDPSSPNMFVDMILSTSAGRDTVELVAPGERVVEPLGVGIVGAEAHAVGADQVDEAGHRVLPERVHPDVAVEHLAGVLGELVGHLLVGELEVPDQQADPAAAVLDAQQPHAREPGEHAVADGRRERVLDRAPAVGHRRERLRAERHVLGPARCPPRCSGSPGSRCRRRAAPRARPSPAPGPRTGRTRAGTATGSRAAR